MRTIFVQSIRALLVMTLLTGTLYPLVVTLVGQGLFLEKTKGSVIKRGDQIIGSELLAQQFLAPESFWSRPSNSNYQSVPTGASNLGPTSQKLNDRIQESLKNYPNEKNVPYELLMTSGSGLDPHVSPGTAKFQVKRISESTGINPGTIENLIDELTEPSTGGVLGRPRVNVLKLNLALQALKK
jgi:K+-transporting ATPase ATPase C chain